MLRALATISICVALGIQPAVSQEPSSAPNRLDRLPDTLQELREKTNFDTWSNYQVYSRTLKHYRTIRVSEHSNVVISETGKSAGQSQFVEVIKPPVEQENAEFAIYDSQTGKRLSKYPEEASFPVEGAPDASKESIPTVCIWCHHEQRPLVAVIPFSQSFQNSMDRVRNRVGIRQSLADPIPKSVESRDRLEQLNSRMDKLFPGRYSDMRVWLQPSIDRSHE